MEKDLVVIEEIDISDVKIDEEDFKHIDERVDGIGVANE